MIDTRRWITLGAVLLLGVLLYLLHGILSPFLIGILLAYLADPLVDRLERAGLSRTAGVVLVFTLFSLEAVFLGFLGSALGVVLAMITGTAVSSALSAGLLADLNGLTLIAFDPVSIATIILVVMLIAFLAGTLPAARAARADPVESLRYE